jgi:hypothetical protein
MSAAAAGGRVRDFHVNSHSAINGES